MWYGHIMENGSVFGLSAYTLFSVGDIKQIIQKFKNIQKFVLL